jgi:sulfate-transporting ATPase
MIVKLFVYFLLSLPLIGAYAMLAVGIVVVFRASRVLNLAHGAMAMLPAYVVFEASKRGLPMLFALPLGIAAGAGLGALIERFFVRPLARQGTTAQTVGTVAVYGLVVAAAAQIWGSGSLEAPHVFPGGGVRIAGSLLTWGQLGLFAISLASTGGFFALFRFTSIGLALRGSAENPRAAGLMGINADRMARIAWMLGGALAGLAGILLAAATNLQPYSLSLQMLPAFVAALIGGLASLPGGLIGAFVVGGAQGMVSAFSLFPGLRDLASQVGMPQLVLTIIALAAMYFRGGKYSVADAKGGLATSSAGGPTFSAYRPDLLPSRGGRKRLARYFILVVLVTWPFVGVPTFLRPLDTYSLLGDAILAGEYFLAASSIVLLTGWVGQISLSQAAFVGISAFGSALITRHFGIAFPFTLLLGAALSSVASAFLGVIALRVRGLYLAVATLIFAWMADEYLFVVPWFAGKGGTASARSAPVGIRGAFPFFDFSNRRTFYFIMLAVASSVLFGLLNLRDSKTGRGFFAVRGSEIAAASLGIDVVRYKLLAFATAGFIAGIAGNLILAHQVTVVPEQFALRASLLFLAIAVVGGLRSLGGSVAASAMFAALAELFFRVPALGEYLQVVSALLLAVILLVYPGGLAALPHDVRRFWARVEHRVPTAAIDRARDKLRPVIEQAMTRVVKAFQPLADLPAPLGFRRRLVALRSVTGLVVPVSELQLGSTAVAPVEPKGSAMNGDGLGATSEGANGTGRDQGETFASEPAEPHGTSEGDAWVQRVDLALGRRVELEGPVIRATEITVRFGGLTAVENASLEVRAGQIVGLIGPNGAGKTTLFNAVSGLNNPASGRVELLGEDVTEVPVHGRAARGLGRTFQVIQLFPELTVFENLLVASHLHNPATIISNVFVTAKSLRGELAAEETCRRVVRFLNLDDIADRPVAGLSFGTLRMVEIGRALATGAPVLMLDEPASGLDNSETDRLSELLLLVREKLGISILLIEHDVRMVTALSDYMYVLNRGKMLAQGEPAIVQRDAAVIAAYLGEAPTEEPAAL